MWMCKAYNLHDAARQCKDELYKRFLDLDSDMSAIYNKAMQTYFFKVKDETKDREIIYRLTEAV